MPKGRKKNPAKKSLDWSHAKTYEELKAFVANHRGKTTPEENWAIMERMRQLRYGYEPGELKMDKSGFKMYTLEEFRKMSEEEYEEEIKKFGPR